MKEQDVMFSAGVAALGGARSCRLQKLAPDASAVLLSSLEAPCPPLLLGCVRLHCPASSPVVTAGELAALGLSAEDGDDVDVFCRLSIPDEDPLRAGFDLSRLVLVASSTGRALEAARPGAPVMALKTGGAGR